MNDDIKLHTYQDDLTTDDDATDPIMDEETDDPTEELGVPVDEFGERLDEEVADQDIVDRYGRDDIDILDDEESRTEDLFTNDPYDDEDDIDA